jgi:hypothetical protein
MIHKPNISEFEAKKSRIRDILKKRNVPTSETQLLKFLNPHEIVLAEIKVVLKYLLKTNEIDLKMTDSTSQTKFYIPV